MPRIFVYEFLSVYGDGSESVTADSSLEREGAAMLGALARDFRRIPGMEVICSDRSISPERERSEFERRAADSDYTIVIAPEFGQFLVTRVIWASYTPTRLLGPTPEGVRATADKLDLARHWHTCGVPTPRTTLLSPESPHYQFRCPVVLKHPQGAGSNMIYRCETRGEFDTSLWACVAEHGVDPIAQDYVPGRPVSVAFLIGPNQMVPLVPTFQRLSDDGRFKYLGGELPIPPALAERAVRLGRRAVECVPGLAGYVGVDLVLGDAADGTEDYAIEINPRLTTSYVGLRALADFNIAQVMLDVFEGHSVGELRWKAGRVRFGPDGRVEYDPTPGAVWE